MALLPPRFVLVHGLTGYRHLLGVDYFRHVAKHLHRNFGAVVLATHQHVDATIPQRAIQLGQQIQTWQDRLGCPAPLHLITHSSGAQDARCLVSPAFPAGPLACREIRTISMIAAPHRGSALVDLAAQPRHEHRFRGTARLLQTIERVLRLIHIPPTRVFDYTTERMIQFNAAWPDNPAVRYLSVAGCGRTGLARRVSLMNLVYDYLDFTTQEPNDGFVHVSSARYGLFDPVLWPGDHFDEVGYNMSLLPGSRFDHLPYYTRLAERALAESEGETHYPGKSNS